MNKAILLLILVIVNSISCFSQISSNKEIQNLTIKYIKELKEKKIDTIFLFEAYSVGAIIVFEGEGESCEYESENTPTYIIWKQYGKSFLTKINSCNTYSALEIDAEKIWTTFSQNKEIIRKEKVKEFQYLAIKNGKKKVVNIGVDHSYHQNLEIIIKDQRKEIRFDDFYFEEYLGSDKKIANINYLYNKNLKSKIVMKEISKVVFGNEKLLTKTKAGL